MQKERKTPALRPILFNTAMVRAILEGRESDRRRAIQAGRKTATRRVIRWERNNVIKVASARGKIFGHIPEDEPIPETLLAWYMDQCLPRPYAVADVLCVRETWGDYRECDPDGEGRWYLYRADYPDGADEYEDQSGMVFDLPKWHPSIHMTKDAARIFLRVTEVFPERLRESFDEVSLPMRELAAEGIPIYEACRACIGDGRENRNCRECKRYDQPRWEFSRLWDSTIRKDRRAAKGWAADPWVWVVRFERVSREEARAALTME